jgi:hypothetical protein
MLNADSSPASRPQRTRYAPSRRSILSILPAALLVGWRVMSGRSESVPAVPDAAPATPPDSSEQAIQTYSYTYDSDPAESPASSCHAIEMTVVV